MRRKSLLLAPDKILLHHNPNITERRVIKWKNAMTYDNIKKTWCRANDLYMSYRLNNPHIYSITLLVKKNKS